MRNLVDYRHVKKVYIDNLKFDSKREAARYVELKLMEKAGLISALMLQPVFVLLVRSVEGIDIAFGKYIGDFTYIAHDGEIVVEDVKGVKTAVYKLKKRAFEAQYGIRIKEV